LLGADVLCQVALVVRDIEEVSRAWAKVLGAAPPPIRETEGPEVTEVEYRGASTPGRAKLAFFQLGEQVSLELIQPIGGPSVWQEWLERNGEGFHHLAFRVQGLQEVVGQLQQEGIRLVQRGEFKGGRYAYLDAAASLKVLLELLETGPKAK
jgi:catechol 2,3-dioxygenase-like lactoylglutathione lyase family enzyme